MVGLKGIKHLQVSPLPISDVKLVVPRRHDDERGYFFETFNRNDLAAAGIAFDGVQDNQSFSIAKGTIRGLHFQLRPFAQAKLVRASRGSIFDVAVDLRSGSASYGKHVSAVLRAEGLEQLYIPAGFAHGYCTLEPDTEVHYKVDVHYSPEHECGIRWNDPELGIEWPVTTAEVSLSAKDEKLPLLRTLEPPFALSDTPGWARGRAQREASGRGR